MNFNIQAPRELTDLQKRRALHQQQIPPFFQNTLTDDEDDFVNPPPRPPLLKKEANIVQNAQTNAKHAKKPTKHARPPTARCAPAIFNTFVDHLTMSQRTKIIGMGFGGLLQKSAEGLESRDLLQFLMDRLNPMNMEIDIGKERPLRITPSVVKRVLDIAIGEYDTPAPTKSESSQALVKFRELVHVKPNGPVKTDYLQMLLQNHKFDDDMAVKFFFIIAFNKMLFPDTSNNIRGKDVCTTHYITCFSNMNWCKAVVDNLRDAALSWHVDREKEGNKSISGCSILLIIFYLDNLRCQHQINHTDTPRAKFFTKTVIEQIMKADRTKDKDGKITFGKLPLRNRKNTCYHKSAPTLTQVSSAAEAPSATHYPSIQSELGVLADRVAGTTRKREVSQALAAFDSQTENAMAYIRKGQSMLLEAHHEVVRTVKKTLEKEVLQNISQDTDERPTTRRKNSHGERSLHADKATQLGGDLDAGVEPVVGGNGAIDPVRDVEAPALTQKPESTVDEPLKSNPLHKEHNNKDGATSDVDAIIDMIDASVDPKFCPELQPVISQEPIETQQPELHMPYSETQVDSAKNSSKPVPSDLESDHQDMDGAGPIDIDRDAFQDQGNSDTSDDKLGPVLMRMCTQEENLLRATVAAPSKRLTRVPAKYVSPFKGIPVRPKIPFTKAVAVRKKFCQSLKSSREIFITVGCCLHDGNSIFESFGDDETENMLSFLFMTTIVQCMRHDEESHMPDGGGYRVFLDQDLADPAEYMKWPEDAERILQQSLTRIAPNKVKLFFLPVMDDNQWSVYCINMIHKRIDILDSNAANHTVYHEEPSDRIIPRLNALFQQVTNGSVKDFGTWRRPVRHLAEQACENDSGFFAVKFMELWNGDALITPVLPDKITQIRSELLFYLLYHPLNETKELPSRLEAFRPRPW